MHKILDLIVLPAVITEFERCYLARMNRIGLAFFAVHVPVLALIAFLNDTGPWLAVVLSVGVMLGPALAYRAFANPRVMSVAYGFTAMLMGGLLVHFGQGPVQIEMHFYFFALLAMLVLFGNPLAIIVAAVTVALHHLILWLVLPASVFNYDAELWVVAVHAAFVVLESIAACFIARSFFDNVIGLEKIVRARTSELDQRNREMRLVLDNVQQGLLIIDREGVVTAERSTAVEVWLGPIAPRTGFAEVLRPFDKSAAAWFEVAWPEVIDGVMPSELTLAQLPNKLVVGLRHLEIGYYPIDAVDGAFEKLLVVISDVTVAVQHARLEAEQRELMALFTRVVVDRRGVVEFLEEGTELVTSITHESVPALPLLRRTLHTLKGNAGIFGVGSIAEICHALESQIDSDDEAPSVAARRVLADRWDTLLARIGPLLGERTSPTVDVEQAQYRAVLRALREQRPHAEIERELEGWQREPTSTRLARIADQARRIALRLGKGEIDVDIAHNDLRLDPSGWAEFWSAFIHVVRNAVDHGIESTAVRSQCGKPPRGRIRLSTHLDDGEFVIAIEDDGAGLDLEALSAAAARVGVSPATAEETLAAMFRDGVSTATTLSEYSGRGVGMGAVKAACNDRGGRVVTRSECGQFTRFEFRFPSAAPKTPSAAAA